MPTIVYSLRCIVAFHEHDMIAIRSSDVDIDLSHLAGKQFAAHQQLCVRICAVALNKHVNIQKPSPNLQIANIQQM